uniref:Uncharacterized protein n=1 Tax=Romanomermis culicivorax TaxID=13658 RepID=A0A915HHH4_ROMCU
MQIKEMDDQQRRHFHIEVECQRKTENDIYNNKYIQQLGDGERQWSPRKTCYLEACAALPIWLWFLFFEIDGHRHIFTMVMVQQPEKRQKHSSTAVSYTLEH